MGATTFGVRAKGNTAREAFNNARQEALHESGHGGYTGTIAEKNAFVMIVPNAGETPVQCARRLIDEGDERIDDKWGPAGCIEVKPGEYLFFGWASE